MALKSPLVNAMIAAARKASRGLIRDFGEVEQLQVSRKGPADFVSAADVRAEQVVLSELRRARPRYGVLAEESGEIPGEDTSNRWVVDPLDGTLNFLHGIPHFCISIALERDGDPFAGVIYDPLRDEMFWAERGGGAYLNDRRLRVSARQRLDEAVVATGLPPRERERLDVLTAQMTALTPVTAGIRRLGSAALDLAYVAAGRYEGFWESGLAPWDVAAGIVIVREAGGLVDQPDSGGRPGGRGTLLATNDRLHDAIAGALRTAERGAPRDTPAAAARRS
jgi:myo-inositol-1(or 4)-monophosphatase